MTSPETHPPETWNETSAKPISRYRALDVLKGLGLLLMIQAHCLGWWLESSAHATPLFSASVILGWFAAPIFLFVVGCTIVISVNRRRQLGHSEQRVAAHMLWRVAVLICLGYLLNLATFTGTPRGDWQSVGVLQCIGVCVLFGYLATFAPAFLPTVLAAVVVLATPMVRDAAPLANTPLQGYLINIPVASNYALFPWIAYTLLGVDVGGLLVARRQTDQRKSLLRLLLAVGLGLVLLGGYALYKYLRARGAMPADQAVSLSAYLKYPFWYPSELFIVLHCGCVLIEIWLVSFLRRLSFVRRRLLRPLEVLGRESVLVFVAHHLLGYRVWHTLGLSEGGHGTTAPTTAVAGTLIMCAGCYVLAIASQRLRTALRSRRSAV